jgi:flagellar hook-length control protein FliK
MTAAEAMKAMKSDAIDLTNTRAHKHAHATSETKDLSAGAKAVKLNANALGSVDTKKSFKVDTTLLSGKLQTANDKTTVIAPAKNTDFKTNLTQASQVQNLPVQPASTKSKDSASLTGININATTAQNIASGTSKIIEKNQDNQKETANKEKGQAESLTVADNAQSLQSENPVSNVNESNQPFNADEKPIAMQKFDVNLKGQISSLEAKQVKVEEKLAAAPRVEATPAQQNVMLAEQVKATATPNHIAPQVGKSGWDQALGQKVMWMVAGGDQVAQLTLNPPDLGPLQVVLSISDSQVDASFVSAHLDVREAIEAAAPKLKEMMDSAGIQLSGFSVSSQSAGSQNQMADGRPFTSGIFKQNTTSESSTPIKLTSAPVKNQVKPGGIDTFV